MFQDLVFFYNKEYAIIGTMIHTSKNIARSSAIYTSTLVFQKILSFIYFSVLARALGPETLGTYIFALSFASLFSLLVDFGFIPLSIRTFSQSDSEQKATFQNILGIRIISTVVSVTLLYITALLLGYDSALMQLITITAGIMVLDQLTAFFWTVFRAKQNLVYESIGTALFQIIIFGVGITVVTRTQHLPYLLGVIALGSVWHVCYSSYMVHTKTNLSLVPTFKLTQMRVWLHKALPFFFATAFIKAYNTIDSILIKNMLGDDAVGLYSIPAKVVFTFPFIALAFTASVYPAMSNYATHAHEKLASLFNRMLLLLFVISLPIAGGISILADTIVMRVWPEFSASIPALQVLIWAVVFLYIEYPFGSLLNATGNEKRNTIHRAIQLVVTVALLVYLLPIYGFMGAVYAALFGSVLIVVLGWLKARSIVRIGSWNLWWKLVRVIGATIGMMYVVQYILLNIGLFGAIGAGVLSYLCFILLLRVYTAEDLLWLKGMLHK